ncbi:helix-turn-helix domain-containing protein [Lutibaculum baratangense]|uniref:Transcriptional regulator, Crp/Fnr family n=1 Tax=Lutibaculum baratangense AMV1 TaxID=631454 RepID=V4TKT6_9HYPH|nr:helix-turn-helix domain-containing protein [Lutibaculum baratangense]ESR26433.1 transcriptional regulator, Crp/Fnr family [Lutibaculum baratangense AMV1]
MHTATQHALREINLPQRHRGAGQAASAPKWSRLLSFAPHAEIFSEGDPANSIWEIIEGAVMLYKLLPDGRRQVVELLGPGDFFGFGAEDIVDCSAETLTGARIQCHDRRSSENCTAFQTRLMAQVRRRVHALHEHTVLLGRKSAVERVASFLLGLTGGEVIRLNLSRQEIADYLGLTIETVSRSFTELRKRGAIALDRQDTVRLTDRGALGEIAGNF